MCPSIVASVLTVLKCPFSNKSAGVDTNEGEEKDERQTHASGDYDWCAEKLRVVEVRDEAL
jgi:hypothetical protein